MSAPPFAMTPRPNGCSLSRVALTSGRAPAGFVADVRSRQSSQSRLIRSRMPSGTDRGVASPGPRHPELMSVGADEVIVTFTTPDDTRVTTRVGDHEVVTTGPRHVAQVVGLEPDTDYAPRGRGRGAGRVPARARADAGPPAGARCSPPSRRPTTCTSARRVCGVTGYAEVDALGPIFTAAPGDDPYPEVMSRGGDRRDHARSDPTRWWSRATSPTRGPRSSTRRSSMPTASSATPWYHVRGNHDAMTDPTMAIEDAPYAVDLPSGRTRRARSRCSTP